MDRRGFLGSILAACVAPAIVRADSLMRIVPLDTTLIVYGEDSIEIDALWREALQRHAEKVCNPPIIQSYADRMAAALLCHMDVMSFGTGALMLSNDGTVRHVPRTR